MRKAQYVWWWLFGASFIFGHLGRYLAPNSIIGRINLLDLAVLLAVTLYIKKIKVDKLLQGFMALLVFSFFIGFAMFGFTTQPESLFFLLRLLVYLLFISVAPTIFGKRSSSFLMLLGVLTAVVGLFQLKVFPSIPVSMIATHGFDPHNGRLFATFFDPNFAAVVLLITILATLNLLFAKYSHQTLLALLIQLYAMILTNSRSGLLALLVGLTVFFLMKDRKYLLLLVSFSMVAFVLSPALSARIRSAVSLDATSQARFASWQTAQLIVNESPIIGVGYNNYAGASTFVGRYHQRVGNIALSANASDSSLLTLWATVGLLGMVIFLLYWLSLTLQNQPLINSAVGAIIVNSFFLNSWLWPFTLFLLALVIVKEK